jgi:hypothetical protein
MSLKVMRTFSLTALAASLLTIGLAGSAMAGGDWNDSGVTWRTYEDGLAAAKAENKPVCLVFYTDWCPHCTNYSKVFHDPRVVEKSKQFVMIRLNKDETPGLSSQYAPDGEYIPRTYFLAPDGSLRAEITEQRPTYKYFYNEHDAASLLRSMDVASAPAQPAVLPPAPATPPAAP